MKKNLLWTGAAILVIIALIYFVGIQNPLPQPDSTRITECSGNGTTVVDGQIFTCVDGSWVYTGLVNEDKG